jgi:lipid A 4'-phosphatase
MTDASVAADPRIPFDDYAGARETAVVFAVAGSVGLATGLAFMFFPGLDIAASRIFLESGYSFSLADSPFWQGLREWFMRGFTLWYVTIAIAGIAAFRQDGPVMSLDWKRWFYIGSCSLLGPLILVNVVLKEYWGRWRPRDIFELGGREIFTPVLATDGTCVDNCSFVSGEVASMVMLFMALAFATRHWRPIHYGLAVLLGLISAFIRVGQGGHFLSDAIFAGVLMALLAAALHAWFFLSGHTPLPFVERQLRRS